MKKIGYDGRWYDGQVHVEADNVQELTKTIQELRESEPRINGQDRTASNGQIAENFPQIAGSLGCGAAILAVLESDWGKREPRTEGEMSAAMKANAVHYPHGSISAMLISLTRRGMIRRTGKKNGSYSYVLSQRPDKQASA